MKIRSIRQAKKISGKKVLLRADFNVPLEQGKIKDDFKIAAGLATIRFLERHNCRIIIITHLGRPAGRFNQNLSARPIAARLSRLLGKKVSFVPACDGFEPGTAVSRMKARQIILLENLRFAPGEEKNDNNFARQLAGLADIYVNNAFAVSHRRNASVSAVKNYLPSYAGLLLKEEVERLHQALNHQRPLVLVVGGSKVRTKIKLIKKLTSRASHILVGGVVANNFLAAHKIDIGHSLVDKESISLARSLKERKIVTPLDVVVAESLDRGRPTVKNIYDINKNEMILDIGPETIKLYAAIIKQAKTIIYNGPMGMFEAERFRQGSLAIARLIASRASGPAFAVAGGGETIEALKLTKMLDQLNWVSTGGGAMLAYLSGETMPGLKGIVK